MLGGGFGSYLQGPVRGDRMHLHGRSALQILEILYRGGIYKVSGRMG